MSAAQDGRARAIHAATLALLKSTPEEGEPEEATRAIDAALADGGLHAGDACPNDPAATGPVGFREIEALAGAERAEAELYRLRCHAAMLADHVRGLVTESDRVEREGDDAEQDWTRPLIDMPVRKALERLMATLARLSKLWDSYPPSERERAR